MASPVEVLQENASDLFDRIQSAYSAEMKCRKGCNACCAVDLTVSRAEAERMVRWYSTLSEEDREQRLTEWSKPASEIKNIEGKSTAACVFLRSGACTIYEARPVICRTQGAPLYFEREKKNQIEGQLDHCPLNFTSGPPKESTHWVHLDRLNSLVSVANRSEEGMHGLWSKDLDALQDENDRIPLRTLMAFLQKVSK